MRRGHRPGFHAKAREMAAARFTVGPGTREMIMSDIAGELARVQEAFPEADTAAVGSQVGLVDLGCV